MLFISNFMMIIYRYQLKILMTKYGRPKDNVYTFMAIINVFIEVRRYMLFYSSLYLSLKVYFQIDDDETTESFWQE